jgi:hypothetical protein
MVVDLKNPGTEVAMAPFAKRLERGNDTTPLKAFKRCSDSAHCFGGAQRSKTGLLRTPYFLLGSRDN